MKNLICCNLKISFHGHIFDLESHKKIQNKSIKKLNYIIIYFNHSTVITLYENNYNIINVTGIKNKITLKKIKKLITFNLFFKTKEIKVNNSLFKYVNLPNFSIKNICNRLNSFPILNYKYNFNYKFPAIFLKYKYKNYGFPTALIFNSGKVIFLGAKKIIYITNLLKEIKKCFQSVI